MASEEIDYHWQSEYLADIPFDTFARLTLREQAYLCKSTFSNFIRYALQAEARDAQQAQFIYEIDDALATGETPDISVRSGHGTGKTTILSWAILYVGLVFDDVKIPVTAPAAAQLVNMLMPEVKKWHKKMHPYFARLIEPLTEDVRFHNGNKCFARTARKENTEALAGVHATLVVYIIDEASGVDQRIFEVIEGALTGNYLRLMASNPTKTTGTFYDSHKRNRKHYRTVHMDSEKSANVKKSWVRMMEDKYGRDSSVFAVRVKGEFPDTTTDAIIPMATIEAATEREQYNTFGAEVWGVDYADEGDDRTILVRRKGNYFYQKDECPVTGAHRQIQTAAWLNVEFLRARIAGRAPRMIFVDAIGEGSGLVSALRTYPDIPVMPVKGSNAATNRAVYFNKRTELYYRLKEALEDEGRMFNDDEAVEECAAQRFEFSPQGLLKAIRKEVIKDELGRSPDISDAMALTCETKYPAASPDIDELNDPDFMSQMNANEAHPSW